MKRLCSGCENRSLFSLLDWFRVVWATHAPPPYLLKSLSVSTEEPKEGCLYLIRSRASSIAASARDIVLFQLHSLDHVSIHVMGFCYGIKYSDFEYSDFGHRIYYCSKMEHRRIFGKRNVCIPEYCSLLSTLTDLLRQPQLQSVSVGESPLFKTYHIIETFLCTETTHRQSLAVIGIRDKESTCIPPSCSPALPLPDSNGTLKSLDIGSSLRLLHSWLINIPKLQLKELKTSRPRLVESVSFPVNNQVIDADT